MWVTIAEVGLDAFQVGRLKERQHVLPALLIALADHRPAHRYPERQAVNAAADRLGRQPVKLNAVALGPLPQELKRLLELELGHLDGHAIHVARQFRRACGE